MLTSYPKIKDVDKGNTKPASVAYKIQERKCSRRFCATVEKN